MRSRRSKRPVESPGFQDGPKNPGGVEGQDGIGPGIYVQEVQKV